jgi:histidine ammonia-lyase
MGVTAARHCQQILQNSEHVLAVELMSAVQGLDCGEWLRPGRGVDAAYACVRAVVPPLQEDRFLAPDIGQVVELIRSGALLRAVREGAGVELNL